MALIGPRMRSGDFYNRKRVVRRSRPRPTRKAASVSLIKRVLNSKLETKYVTNLREAPAPVILTGHITPATDVMLMLAPVPIQTATASSNVREGDTIQPLRATTSGHVYFNNIANDVSKIVFVKIFMCMSKDIKDYALSGNLQNAMLENGTDNPVPWTAAQEELQTFLPVAKSLYTVMKTFTIKLSKVAGLAIGGQVASGESNIGTTNDRVPFSFSWKPPTLKYAGDGFAFPQNHAPFMFAVAYSPGYNYDTDASLIGSVSISSINQLWFKDA